VKAGAGYARTYEQLGGFRVSRPEKPLRLREDCVLLEVDGRVRGIDPVVPMICQVVSNVWR